MKLLVTAVAILVGVWFVSSASARTISSGFESNSVVSTAAYPDNTNGGNYYPDALADSASVAYWTWGGSPSLNAQVTSYNAPGAHSGSNYLRLNRTTPGTNALARIITGGGGDQFFSPSNVRIDTWTYAAGAGWQNEIDVCGDNGSVYPAVSVAYGPSNNVVYLQNYYPGSGGAWASTSLNATQGGWQHLIIDMNLGTQKMSISLDGNTVSNLPFNLPAAWVNQFDFIASNTTAYFDDINISDVPEPATLTLLAFGLLTVLRPRRS